MSPERSVSAEERAAGNPLGYQPIGRLLLNFSIPSVISMLVNSIYNIVDQIFIGQGVGELGNAATTVSFPMVTITPVCPAGTMVTADVPAIRARSTTAPMRIPFRSLLFFIDIPFLNS